LRPLQVHLQAVNEIWQVNYGLRTKAGVGEYRRSGNDNQLWVWTPEENGHQTAFFSQQPSQQPTQQMSSQTLENLSRHCLQQWLSMRAKSTLHPWLRQVSDETGLMYRKLCVRAQKTRWGSCSNQKHINLNRALMFLPAELVRYLMIHELSHTVHLNHSRAFWALVARWEPQYKKYEALLNQYSSRIPLWALP